MTITTINSRQTITVLPGYILVERPPGYEVVMDEQSKALLELAALCNTTGCNKVLVVGPRTYMKLSAFDILEMGREIAKLQLQMAIAEIHDASNDAVDLLESVASNHGGAVRFFDNTQDAREWLEIA